MKDIIKVLTVTTALLASVALHADTLDIPDRQESNLNTPERGITMAEVERRFGTPTMKHSAVGEPPITRWDYSGYSVYFEHERVITSVADTQ